MNTEIKYEHTVKTIPYGNEEDFLNRMGDKGWGLCAMDTSITPYRYYFKRLVFGQENGEQVTGSIEG